MNGYSKVVAHVPRDGFETAIPINRTARLRYLRAAALDRDANIIGTSKILDMTNGTITEAALPVTSVNRPKKIAVQIYPVTSIAIEDDRSMIFLLALVLAACCLYYIKARRWVFRSFRSWSKLS